MEIRLANLNNVTINDDRIFIKKIEPEYKLSENMNSIFEYRRYKMY